MIKKINHSVNSFKIYLVLIYKTMSILFINTETQDLPPMKGRNFLNPKKYKKYNDSRLLELNWIIMNDKQEKILKSKNKFEPKTDTENKKLKEVLDNLLKDLKEHKIKKIVGYNVLFHYHVVIAEAYRVKNGKLLGKFDFINHKEKVKVKPVCSMAMCQKYMDIENMKFPKLDELYYLFFKKQKDGIKLTKGVKCFYRIKTLKEDKELAQKYRKKYLKYLTKLSKLKK